MRSRRSRTAGIALAALLLVTASSSFGQEPGKRYKMTTPIPEGIAMPFVSDVSLQATRPVLWCLTRYLV
jgi:hypothetical protein